MPTLPARMQADAPEPQAPGGGNRVTSPLPDIFTTQTIATAITQLTPPQQFLLDNFFGNERFFGGRFLTVETKRQKRVLAPVVSRYHPGVVVQRPPHSSISYDVPKIAPFRNISLAQLDVRGPSQFAGGRSGGDATAYASQLIADDSMELQALIQRRTELYASQILTTGKVRYRLDGGEYEEFGYGPNVPTVFAPAVDWSDAANSTPISDLKEVRSQIIQSTGMAPDILVMSDAVADAFTRSEQVLDQLNRLHFIAGQIQPARPAGTAQWLGRLLMPALEMWVYSEMYIDESDGVSVAPMIPPQCALVGCTTPSTTGMAWWGSILQLDENGFQEVFNEKYVPRMLWDLPNESASYRLQSRPCLVPLDCSSFTRLDCIPPPATPKRKNGQPPAIPAEESQPKRKG